MVLAKDAELHSTIVLKNCHRCGQEFAAILKIGSAQSAAGLRIEMVSLSHRTSVSGRNRSWIWYARRDRTRRLPISCTCPKEPSKNISIGFSARSA